MHGPYTRTFLFPTDNLPKKDSDAGVDHVLAEPDLLAINSVTGPESRESILPSTSLVRPYAPQCVATCVADCGID